MAVSLFHVVSCDVFRAPFHFALRFSKSSYAWTSFIALWFAVLRFLWGWSSFIWWLVSSLRFLIFIPALVIESSTSAFDGIASLSNVGWLRPTWLRFCNITWNGIRAVVFRSIQNVSSTFRYCVCSRDIIKLSTFTTHTAVNVSLSSALPTGSAIGIPALRQYMPLVASSHTRSGITASTHWPWLLLMPYFSVLT